MVFLFLFFIFTVAPYVLDSSVSIHIFQHNVMVFIAELFWWFEIVKPEFVHPRDVQELKDGENSIICNRVYLNNPEKRCVSWFVLYVLNTRFVSVFLYSKSSDSVEELPALRAHL